MTAGLLRSAKRFDYNINRTCGLFRTLSGPRTERVSYPGRRSDSRGSKISFIRSRGFTTSLISSRATTNPVKTTVDLPGTMTDCAASSSIPGRRKDENVKVDGTDAADSGTASSKLPPLTAREQRIYNRMAEGMEYYHERFRQTWKMLHNAASKGKRPANLSTAAYVRTAGDFCHHLTVHHTIEEQYIFPVLAKKMPIFRAELDMLEHHRQIHEGVERFEKYLAECRSGERELRLEEVKEVMDSFGDVLWTHLDAEVRQLGAENMRQFWSLEEMQRMPM